MRTARDTLNVLLVLLGASGLVFAWWLTGRRALQSKSDLLPVPPASVEPFVYNPGHPQGPQLVIDANRLSAQTEVCIVREGVTKCDLLAELYRRMPQ